MHMAPAKDLTGLRVGRLVVERLANTPHTTSTGHRRRRWQCQCDCGRIALVATSHLTGCDVQSCGCWRREYQRPTQTHGMSKTRTYSIWRSVRARCVNPKHRAFRDYGARGITICDRWLKFDNFVADMGPVPDETMSIDRIDNARGYDPGNCRWATKQQQGANRSNNFRIAHDGLSLTSAEWSTKTGISQSLIWHRIKTLGWSVRDTLTTPPRNNVRQRKP